MVQKKILGASLGNCVHVAGVSHFLGLAKREGFYTIFLGPSVPVEKLFENILKYRPEIIAISYRLTPQNVMPILSDIEQRAKKLDYKPLWVFGGTLPVSKIALKFKMFSFISDGFDEMSDSIRFLRKEKTPNKKVKYGSCLADRIKQSYPYPILRHHYGVPSLEDTINGVEKISKAKVLDVISLGTDQNAQQFFFEPDKMKRENDGAGGVPIRSEEDLKRIKDAANRGNYPLVRCYSGTQDVFKYAKMLVENIDNAWTAIPLFWYNELDGRGTRTVEDSIAEAQKLIKWHADNNIPVEINEPHHWGLRDAHDVIPVAMAYISAYNAKKMGVKNYISQYMFNTPNGISFSMDFARVLAMVEMVETLEDEEFEVYRETRAGLSLFSADKNVAKGQLAASTFMQMSLKPHIIHVVGFCEADHAATAAEVIESCKIVKGVIRHTVEDGFSMENDDKIYTRKMQLISEAKVLINFIKERFSSYDDPLTSPKVLTECLKCGYIDAVHILKNDKFRGNLSTRFIDGKCEAIDEVSGDVLCESQRLNKLVKINEI